MNRHKDRSFPKSAARTRPAAPAGPTPKATPKFIQFEERTEPGIRTCLYLYATFLLGLITLHTMFTDRMTVGDEDGLYNAIYMYQHYGKVTYPMQLQYLNMTIHPPTHYFIVGVLTKLGMQVFHAAGLPLVILALLSFWAILTGAFRVIEKVSVLTGFTLAALVYMPLFPIRPEMHIAFAWFCGMAFLEAARSLGWENRRLFVGSFFIAYGSALHYWALASALVLPAYFLYILVRPAGARPWRKLGFMVAGALCFYVPWPPSSRYRTTRPSWKCSGPPMLPAAVLGRQRVPSGSSYTLGRRPHGRSGFRLSGRSCSDPSVGCTSHPSFVEFPCSYSGSPCEGWLCPARFCRYLSFSEFPVRQGCSTFLPNWSCTP